MKIKSAGALHLANGVHSPIGVIWFFNVIRGVQGAWALYPIISGL